MSKTSLLDGHILHAPSPPRIQFTVNDPLSSDPCNHACMQFPKIIVIARNSIYALHEKKCMFYVCVPLWSYG